MASIRREIVLSANADAVWDALREFGAVHQRVAPGFVTDCRMDGEARIVTFSNGAVARELFVDADDTNRRLVYAIAPDDRLRHYSAAVEIVPESTATCRLIWTVDLLPHEMAPHVRGQMEIAAIAMKSTLDRSEAQDFVRTFVTTRA